MVEDKDNNVGLKSKDFDTGYDITWCPGCPNFGIRESLKMAFANLINSGRRKSKGEFVVVTDVGCNAKMYDYVNTSAINSLHGRTVPTCHGIRLGNPNLDVVGIIGDGGAYSEGLAHFIHACRNNADFTLLVHDNQIFALTTGQSTPTTEVGFKEKTRPKGNVEEPLNPIALALVSGATFVARANSLDIQGTTNIIKQAIEHKGFSFVEIVQPCISFHNFTKEFKDKSYVLKDNDIHDSNEAFMLAGEHIFQGKVPIGIFYKMDRPTFESKREILNNLMNDKKSFLDINRRRSVLKDFLPK